MLRLAYALLAVALVSSSARAQTSDAVETFAIVVGSNTGGPGQTDLRYAEDDARRVGKLLVDLGGYDAQAVEVLAHPSPDELRARIAKLRDKLDAIEAAGRRTRLFFYYSGHARATALDLGKDQMPLAELRERLLAIKTTVTVIVLDACQSGAFSRVKGAEPAADFSFNSKQQLDATGVAVLASSTGSELSQESEQLKSSYFTHHLLVGLRGASDANRDGLVTIDEAYRYAYHQTLLSTAETAVGGQHVTLEVDLKGHGEVPMSFPRAATSHIELPGTLEGKTLVEDKRSSTVIAETYKAKGAAVRIAVAPGEYRVIVRRGKTLSRCEVSAGGIVDLDHCTNQAIVEATTKGGDDDYVARPTRVEIMLSLGGEHDDAYTDNLKAFGYEEQGLFKTSSAIEAIVLRYWRGGIWFGGTIGHTTMPSWRQQVSGSDFEQNFTWGMTRVAAVSRTEYELAETGFFSHLSLYVQATVGLGIGRTRLVNADHMTFDDTHYGLALGGGFGLHLESPNILGFGMTLGYENDAAWVIKDLIGNTHVSGGNRVAFALSYGF
ncbi:MAG: caspase family protein [Kofleriaceae bacterium]|nr:caspase family protein [Kofleriaceae bacterium]